MHPISQTRVGSIACAILLGRLDLVPEHATTAEIEAGLELANHMGWELAVAVDDQRCRECGGELDLPADDEAAEWPPELCSSCQPPDEDDEDEEDDR